MSFSSLHCFLLLCLGPVAPLSCFSLQDGFLCYFTSQSMWNFSQNTCCRLTVSSAHNLTEREREKRERQTQKERKKLSIGQPVCSLTLSQVCPSHSTPTCLSLLQRTLAWVRIGGYTEVGCSFQEQKRRWAVKTVWFKGRVHWRVEPSEEAWWKKRHSSKPLKEEHGLEKKNRRVFGGQ